MHPFIQGLLDTLPLAETGKKSEWPVEERAMWLQTAASIFGLIYTSKPDPSGGSQTIKVSVDKGDQNKSSGS